MRPHGAIRVSKGLSKNMHPEDNKAKMPEQPTRNAAMYVRMSTDHQKYSTENQADAIREYADRHKMTIVRTYRDEGKSGLKLDGRDALQSLITDVQSGKTDYLSEKKRNKRPRVHYMLNKWEDDLYFYYVPIDDKKFNLAQLEIDLNDAISVGFLIQDKSISCRKARTLKQKISNT